MEKNEEALIKEFLENSLRYYEELSHSKSVDQKEIKKRIGDVKVDIRKCEYRGCNHLYVMIPFENEYEDRYFGCVKCGFSNAFASKLDNISKDFSEEETASLEYMSQFVHFAGTDTGIWCDLELAKAIYKKIKEAHPEATDEQISNYLSYALYKMRTEDQTETRIKSRVKRLGLKPDFNAWNKEFEQD